MVGTLSQIAQWGQDKPGAFPDADAQASFALFAADVQSLLDVGRARVLAEDALQAKLSASGKRAGRAAQASPNRPRRDLAMLALFFSCGLPIQELVGLRRRQYDGQVLHRVVRKGRHEPRRLFLPAMVCELLDDYLGHEHPLDVAGEHSVALFLTTRSGGFLTSEHFAQIIKRLAEEAGVAAFGLQPRRAVERSPRHATDVLAERAGGL